MPVVDAPARAASRGPSTWTRLTLGLLALPLAAALLVAAALWSVDHSGLDEQGSVVADGEPRTVEVDAGRTAFVWAWQGWARQPDCAVVDAATGREVETRPASGRYERGGGTAAPWSDHLAFDPPSGTVEVTCTSTSGAPDPEVVLVQAAPRLPWWLDVTWWVLGPPLLVASAGLWLAGSGVRRLLRAPSV